MTKAIGKIMGIKQKDRKEEMRRGIINLEGEVTKKRNSLREEVTKKRNSQAGESQERRK